MNGVIVTLQCKPKTNVLLVHLPWFAPCLSLPPLFFFSHSPCYEAIHHKILDSEEIILYIEGYAVI